MFKTIEAGLF